jgi:hypothetical protein
MERMEQEAHETKKALRTLGDRLKAYSLTAAGALLVAVPQADAEQKCMYLTTPLEVRAGGGPVSIDINGDGQADFLFSVYPFTNAPGRVVFISAVDSVNNFVQCTETSKYINRLQSGANINAVCTLIDYFGTLAITLSGAWIGSARWNGPIQRIGFIGVNLDLGDGRHEGWIKYKQTTGLNENLKGFILAYGYESTPNQNLTTNANCSGATAVELFSFTAEAKPQRVILKWKTGAEIDTAGFRIWRSKAKEGPYQRITKSIIPAKGSATSGAQYTFQDRGVKKGQTYYYKLEDLDSDGKSSMHGPIAVQTAPLRKK